MMFRQIQRWKRQRRLAAIAKDFALEGGFENDTFGPPAEISRLKSILSDMDPLPAPATYIESRARSRASRGAAPLNLSFSRRRFALLTGVGAIAAAAIGAVLLIPPAAIEYATPIGQTTTIALEDGSQLFLSGNSSATVRFAQKTREITLVSGEASFKVAHDAARPFSVEARHVQIVAVGTEFYVSRRNGVEVDVLEGRVLVQAPQDDVKAVPVSAGGKAVANLETGAITLSAAETTRIRSLQQGRLYFDNTPLAEAFEEFEPFSPVRARFTDASLSQLTVSGAFEISGIEDFILSVEQLTNSKVRRNGNNITISPTP